MGLKRVVEMCMNNTKTSGEEDGPLNSQPQKLAVGAPTDTSWAPRAHGVPCARYKPGAHGVPCPRPQNPVPTGYPETSQCRKLKHA